MVVNVNGQQVRVKVVESSDENVLLEGEAILNNIPVQDEIQAQMPNRMVSINNAEINPEEIPIVMEKYVKS